jgi:hypothetical protein
MWLKHEGYEEMIKNAWESRDRGINGITGLWRQLREVSSDIKKWSFDTFGSVRAKIKRLRAQLALLDVQGFARYLTGGSSLLLFLSSFYLIKYLFGISIYYLILCYLRT